MTDIERLTDDEIEEINNIILQLQDDISKVKSNIERRNFDDALKNILEGMKHTSCPVCKEKLISLSVDVIKTKQKCSRNNNECQLYINEASAKAESLKNDFIPIATEKKYIKDKAALEMPPNPIELLNNLLRNIF